MDQYIGKLLDNRYELLERIGAGGMAVVYKARCHRLNRLVAVKILKPDLAGDAEFQRRFHDESQAVAMLSHPNIVAVYDVSRSDHLQYIVMELIDGLTLKQYMYKRGTPLNWREALHFITQIVKALGHAHSRGIIHRDIKPHNIMVLRDGSVKVTDFGIARLTSAAHATLTQEALGSVHYISPEQARGSHIDGRSDLYSAGVVLYEMITGRLPFEGDTPVSVAIQHINSIPLSPRELNRDLPEALETITMKAMAPNVNNRYASADEMLVDLEEFRKNPSISFDYTHEDLRGDKGGNEPTQVVPASHIRTAVSQDNQRRRTNGSQPPRRRELEYDEDEYEEPERRRGISPALIAVAVILLFVGGMLLFLWKSFFSGLFAPVEYITVPDLSGMTMEEIYADAELSANFYIVKSEETLVSDLYEIGEVVKQDPVAESSVKGDRPKITVILNGGAVEEGAELKMPSLAAKDYREAADTLTNLGLIPVRAEENSETIEPGFVVSTYPAAGDPVTEGQSITVVVSIGPLHDPVTVPPLENMTVEQAQTVLEEIKLKLGTVVPVRSTTVEEGYIFYQSVPMGDKVDEGTAISVHVSTGPGPNGTPAETPEVTTPPVEEQPVESQQPTVTQSPTYVESTVTVNLSGFIGTVQVRILVGDSEAYNNPVDSNVGKHHVIVTGTGTQRIKIYVNGALYDEYDQIFTVNR